MGMGWFRRKARSVSKSHFGLCYRALNLVSGRNVERKPAGQSYSCAAGVVQLNKYVLLDGRVYREDVQHENGFGFFLALRDEKGNWIPESMWTKEEMANRVRRY